jgi:MFS superfamily sulfate permease-like transporter
MVAHGAKRSRRDMVGLDMVVGRALGTALMTVRGPLRAGTCDRFTSKVDKVLTDRPERLVLDLTDAVIDDEGVRALRQAQSSAEAHEVQLVLTSKRKEALADLEERAAGFFVV